MMAASRNSGSDDRSPQLSDLTAVDPADPFDATDRVAIALEADPSRHTQLTSDPPTAIVRRDSFRELLPGTVVGDVYEIDARLGGGAMGEVYAARHIRLGKRVAIKVIGKRLSEDAAAIERFAMEARTLAQIQHPAIVTIDHVGELVDGRAFFSMELLRGEPLFDRLQRGRVPLPEALGILDQMARGLDAAHGEGIVHRDVKPENTFLVHLPGEPPLVKIVDFGLSTLRALDQRAERTQSGVAIGTPMYMSPEQMRGPDVDYRTDIYAIGCVAYELVLGRPPFPRARTAPELYAAHLHESPPLPRTVWPEIPPQLDLALFAMLAKDPAHRPTLAQFRAVIADVRAAPSQRAATEFVAPRAAKPPRRNLAIAAIVLVALVGGIAIGTAIGKRPSRMPVAPAVVPITPPIEAPLAPVPGTLPVEDPVSPDPTPAPSPPTPPTPPTPPSAQTRRAGSASRSPKMGSADNVPVTPIDVGVDARAEEKLPPLPMLNKTVPKPIDRNQTINPFAKRPKVNP